MPTLAEKRRASDFIASRQNDSVQEVTIAASLAAALVPGEVLGRRTVGAATAAAAAGNTGNGTFSAVTVAAGAKPGAYKVMAIQAVAEAGQFVVEDPDGVIIGTATVGSPFSGVIGFTISDGATDFIAGDSFVVTVAAGTGQYQPLDLTATNGAAVAAGIAYGEVPVRAATQKAAAVIYKAEVNVAELVWPAGITNDEKNAALAQLAALGIIAR